MSTWRGRWEAAVEQDFEVEADTEEEARALVAEYEMNPRSVVELIDMEITRIERAS